MKLVPEHKSDFEACENLNSIEDNEVITILPELLEWVQDGNWPVARIINKRIGRLGLPLVDPIKEILNGNDETWKYFIITDLLPETNKKVLSALKPDILRMVTNPTKNEIKEEVSLVAKEFLENRSTNV